MSIDQIPIGKFSLMTRLTQKALRLYDKKGLLIPEFKDQITGYRYYSISQIEQGMRIKMLGWIGFNLEQIQTIIEAVDQDKQENIASLFAQRLSETQLEIARLKKIEDLLSDKDKAMEIVKMQVSTPVIKTAPALRVISQRQKGTYGETIGILIGNLMQEIYSPENQRNFVKITGPIMSIEHDECYKEIDADIEVAIPITGQVFLDSEAIEVRNLPATDVVSLIFTGIYDELGMAYDQAYQFMQNSRLIQSEAPRELYLNTPDEVNPTELMTEIQIPFRKMTE